MKKKEAINFIRKQKGYVPYVDLFEIYNDNNEIPQELINIECKKDELRDNFIICSGGLAKQFKKIRFK